MKSRSLAPVAAEAVAVVAVAQLRVAERLQLVEHLRLPAQHLLHLLR